MILTICFFLLLLLETAHAAKDPGKIKLTKLKRLTLRSGQMTTGRRGAPVPQVSMLPPPPTTPPLADEMGGGYWKKERGRGERGEGARGFYIKFC